MEEPGSKSGRDAGAGRLGKKGSFWPKPANAPDGFRGIAASPDPEGRRRFVSRPPAAAAPRTPASIGNPCVAGHPVAPLHGSSFGASRRTRRPMSPRPARAVRASEPPELVEFHSPAIMCDRFPAVNISAGDRMSLDGAEKGTSSRCGPRGAGLGFAEAGSTKKPRGLREAVLAALRGRGEKERTLDEESAAGLMEGAKDRDRRGRVDGQELFPAHPTQACPKQRGSSSSATPVTIEKRLADLEALRERGLQGGGPARTARQHRGRQS